MNFKSLLTFAFAAAALTASAEAPYTYSVGDVVSANGKAYRVVSENIVENGDFSQGFTYWKAGDGKVITDGNFKILEGGAPNGGNALNGQKNEGGAKAASIAHKINLENGKSYFVSLFANTNNGTWCRVNLNATDNASTAFISKESMTQGGWCIYSGAYDCNAENQTIDFQFAWLNTEAKFAYINLVEVEEVPTVNLTSSVLQTKEAWSGSGNYTNAKNNNQSSLTLVEKYAQSHVAADYIPLSQEVSVPNGKYYISLYATANSANIGGGLTDASMTTAQLFATSGENTVTVPMLAGNNSKFVMPGKYNLEIEVTDGKLNLGMKILEADKVNWQTIQIISLLKESTDDDAINVAKALAQEALDSNDYVNVTGEERTALEAALAAENATVESLTAATDTFKNAKPAYDAYAAKVVEVNSVLDNCTLAATAKLDALRALIITPANAAAAETATGSFFDAIRLVVESNAVAEGADMHEDFTSYIINPIPANTTTKWTKENEILDGWYLELLNGNANMRIQGNEAPTLSDGSTPIYYDTDNWNDKDWTSEFSQKISIPTGIYRLAVTARGSDNLGYYILAANEKEINMAHHGSNGGVYGRGWEDNYIDFETLGGEVIISIHGRGNGTGRWESFTNFRLTKIGDVESFKTEAIEAAIAAAEEALANYEAGDEIGKYSTELRNLLESALTEANSALAAIENQPVSAELQSNLDVAANSLVEATNAYVNSEILVVAEKYYYIYSTYAQKYWNVNWKTVKIQSSDTEGHRLLKLSGADPTVQQQANEVAPNDVNNDHKFKFVPVYNEDNSLKGYNIYCADGFNINRSTYSNQNWHTFASTNWLGGTDNPTADHSLFTVEKNNDLYLIKNNTGGYLAPDNDGVDAQVYSNKSQADAIARGAVSLIAVPENQTPTGIEAVAADAVEGDNVVYDLYGRRVENPSNGIYIVNGKKVVIR